MHTFEIRTMDHQCPHGVTIVDGQVVEGERTDKPIQGITINPGPVQLTNSIRKPKGVGDHFHDIIVANHGISPCAKCLEVMQEMNGMGPAGCDRERDQIIQGMWERRNQLPLLKRLMLKIPKAEGPAKKHLHGLLDEAIKRVTG